MSYDLYFWRQSKVCDESPSEIMKKLIEEEIVECVEIMPIDEIIFKIKKTFQEIHENKTNNPNLPIQLIWDSPTDDSCFLLSWSNKYLAVEGHGVDGEIFNTIIDVMALYNCPLYDPQTDTRYEE